MFEVSIHVNSVAQLDFRMQDRPTSSSRKIAVLPAERFETRKKSLTLILLTWRIW